MKTLSAVGLLVLIKGFQVTWCEVPIYENHNLILTDLQPVRLLYGESHGISWTDVSLNDRLPPVLSRRYLDVYSVDYHYRRRLLFYTGWGAVWRLHMDKDDREGQGQEVVEEEAGAATVAVDWERARMYWTSPAYRTVWRADLEGKNRDIIISDTGNLTQHNNVVVDPYMRYLFVATNSGYSLRTDLDGNYLVRLYHSLRQTTVALDIHTRRLYVCGARGFIPVVMSCNYDGVDIVNYKLNYGADWWVRLMSIGVFSGNQPLQMFWVHHGWNDRDTAWKVNVSDNQLSWKKEYTSRGTTMDPANRIWCLKVYHPDVQSRPEYLAGDSEDGAAASASSYIWTRFRSIRFCLLLTIIFQSWIS